MRWPGRKKKLLILLLFLGFIGLLKLAHRRDDETVQKYLYIELPKKRTTLNVKYPTNEKWDLEQVLGTYSEHHSIKSKFIFPASNEVICNTTTVRADKPCIDSTCTESFFTQSEVNLQKVESYPSSGVDKMRKEMLRYIETNPGHPVKANSIVIITGASSEFYHPAQGFFRMIHDKLMRHFENIHLIFYDMGLTYCQRKLVEKYCRCEVKDFPNRLFPNHVGENLKSYAWKPLLIQLELLQHRYVTWMDSSIRLLHQDYWRTYQLGIDNNLMIAFGEFSMAQQTDLKMFDWFNEPPCLFSQFYEVQPGYIMIYRNTFTSEKVMKPWVACALDEGCILPRSAMYDCDNTVWRYGKCHRHDQSAISLILTRLYQKSRELLHLTRFKLKKRENAHYFPEEPSWLCWL